MGRSDHNRNRFRDFGAKSLMPRDALELLLGYCRIRDDTLGLINRLFEQYHTLPDILNAPPDELRKIEGVTDEFIDLVRLMPQLYMIYTGSKIPQNDLDDVETAKAYFEGQFRGIAVEQFKVVCLTDDFSAVCCETVGEGNAVDVNIDTGRIFEIIIKHRARLVMVGHNHPSGSCRPSQSDITSTGALQNWLRGIGVALVDHIICGNDGAVSLMRSGEYPLSCDPSEIAEAIRMCREENKQSQAR